MLIKEEVSMIKTDGLCICKPSARQPSHHHTPEWLWLLRDVTKFTASLEYLSTQLSGRCGRATVSQTGSHLRGFRRFCPASTPLCDFFLQSLSVLFGLMP